MLKLTGMKMIAAATFLLLQLFHSSALKFNSRLARPHLFLSPPNSISSGPFFADPRNPTDSRQTATALWMQHVNKSERGRNPLQWKKPLICIGSFISAFLVRTLAFAQTAAQSAGTSSSSKIKGWDLYGRVPYDDWLFTTARLTNPDLLRKSFQEAVLLEIPDVLANFKRRKTIHDALLLGKGLAATCFVLTFLGLWFMRARNEIKKDREREAAIRGFDMPISATYKGSKLRGRAVEGMDGWIDMSRTEDDSDAKSFWDEDDDDDDEADGNEDDTDMPPEPKKPKKGG